MTQTKRPNQVQAAEKLEKLAEEFAEITRVVSRPSDSNAILGSLESVQRSIVTIYGQLADWHGQALKGVHHDGEKVASAALRDPSWVRAETALAEAARCGADAAKALHKAKKANDQALWFDEVFEDEG